MRSTVNPRRHLVGTLIIVLAAQVSGCAHPFEVTTSLAHRGPLPALSYQADISLMGPQDYARGPYLGCVADALTNVRGLTVLPADRAEVVVRIQPEPSYSGNMQNFFITFPGFLVNLPWAIGYAHTIDVATDIAVIHYGRSRHRLVHHSLDVRHACATRVTVAEMGWGAVVFAPMVLVLFFGGIFHLFADEEDLLPELRYGLRDSYGVDVARHVVELLEELRQPQVAEPPPSPDGLTDG